MSDEPLPPPKKIAPQLIGIALLAALFVACIRNDLGFESRLQQATHQLRVGMTIDEAQAIVGDWSTGEGDPRHFNFYYFDPDAPGGPEVLRLYFDRRRGLTEWQISPDR